MAAKSHRPAKPSVTLHQHYRLQGVYGKDGQLQLYDMYVDGYWHGSRSTLEQCQRYLGHLSFVHTPGMVIIVPLR